MMGAMERAAALFTRISTVPKVATVIWATFVASLTELASAWRTAALPPVDTICSTVCSAASRLISAIITAAPASASRRAVYLSMILGANFSSESGPEILLIVSLIIKFRGHVTTKKGATWLFDNEKGSH